MQTTQRIDLCTTSLPMPRTCFMFICSNARPVDNFSAKAFLTGGESESDNELERDSTRVFLRDFHRAAWLQQHLRRHRQKNRASERRSAWKLCVRLAIQQVCAKWSGFWVLRRMRWCAAATICARRRELSHGSQRPCQRKRLLQMELFPCAHRLAGWMRCAGAGSRGLEALRAWGRSGWRAYARCGAAGRSAWA